MTFRLPTPHLFRKDAPRCQWAVYMAATWLENTPPTLLASADTTDTPQCEREAGHPGEHLFKFNNGMEWRFAQE